MELISNNEVHINSMQETYLQPYLPICIHQREYNHYGHTPPAELSDPWLTLFRYNIFNLWFVCIEFSFPVFACFSYFSRAD